MPHFKAGYQEQFLKKFRNLFFFPFVLINLVAESIRNMKKNLEVILQFILLYLCL